jgi:hypothetical protein
MLVMIFRHAERLEQQENPKYYPVWAKIHPLAISALSGTLGAQSLLFAKGVSIVLRGVYDPGPDSEGGKAFTRYLTYIMLVAMVFCIVSQTHTLNMALEVSSRCRWQAELIHTKFSKLISPLA